MQEITPNTIVDGRYEILERLGSGGMADVYCAQDSQLGRKVALKMLYRRYAQDQEFVERFRREASAAAGLQHPNVVGIYDRGEFDGTYYIAMEYLEGQTLKERVRAGALEPVVAIDIAVQILKAARFAHSRGIIHRDLKPQNVIVDADNRAKVTDFGIARAGASDMTETGSIMGTAQYLSPEQAQGHAISGASDLYAVGIILFELLTGEVPFDGDSAVAVALKQVTEPAFAPSLRRQGIPPELDAIVLRAMEKDPSQRFADADEFIAALEAERARLVSGAPSGQTTAVFGAASAATLAAGAIAAAGAGIGAPPAYGGTFPNEPLPPPEKKSPWPWIVALLAILVIAGGGLAYALTRPEHVSVPNVVGQSVATASTVLANAGFKVDVTRVTDDNPKDRVIRQDPQPLASVSSGSVVTLRVSDGPGDVTVPTVAGQSQNEAEKRLRAAGFKVNLRTEYSDSIPKAIAIATTPDGGNRIEKGATVTLIVSKGVKQVTVPSVTGSSQAAAESTLSNVGLRAAISEKESDQEPGTVLSQSPSSGTKVDKDSIVTIVVAKPVAKVEVPDVVGQDQGAAATTLSGLGLTVIITERSVIDPIEDGKVLSQSPAAGSQVKVGSKVTIVVGHFDEPIPPVSDGTGANNPPPK
ncbi:MAG: Stk1 family PASTA domain-containing Ser/Thr kinase [Actinomycetota bacterium]